MKNSPPTNTTVVSSPDDPDDPQAKLRKIIEVEFGPILINDGEKSVLNQLAFAALFAARNQVAFRAMDGSLVQYSDEEGVWRKVTKNSLVKQMAGMLKELADEVKAPELLAKRKNGLLKDLLHLVCACREFGEPPAPMGKHLPVENGVLDLSGVEVILRSHTSGDWITEKIPFCYNPIAKCERFLNELILPALSNEDDVKLLQRDLGRQLFAGNDAQTITILQGEGGSGKSVLVSIIEAIIRLSKIGYLRSNQLTGRFETHGFIGKSTLVGKDVLPDYLNNQGAAVIKSLTGADRVQTEQKYGGKHEMRGSFYVIITTNGRLTIKLHGDLKAWRRRLVVYEFSRQTPAKIIPNFDQVLLKEEGEGILAWLIEGYLAHRAELREHGTLKLTPTQQMRVDDWLEESDALKVFAKTCITQGSRNITSKEIWDAFTAFAHGRKWKVPREQKFHEELKPVMLELFGVEKSNHLSRDCIEVRGYNGVQFIKKEEAE
jgi:putative DNA primase/helicase